MSKIAVQQIAKSATNGIMSLIGSLSGASAAGMAIGWRPQQRWLQ
jgi:hypothetical protein